MRSQRLLLRLGWILLLSLACLVFWGVAAQAGGVPGLVKPAQYEEAPTRGALDLRIRSDEGAPSPPGELLLSDPDAQMTGGDAAGNRYREIPNSAYRRERGTYHLHVGDAVSGRYSLRVIGTDSGRYTLYMTGYDRDGARADISFTRLMGPGEMHIFLIDYSNVAGARIKARQIHRVE
jgi:hypothetical protein